MDFEKYTDKSKALIQSAQEEALKAGHQRFSPEHVLLALLNDRDRLAEKLIRSCGGHPDQALYRRRRASLALPSRRRKRRGMNSLPPSGCCRRWR